VCVDGDNGNKRRNRCDIRRLIMSTIEIIAQEDISRELYGKSCAELSKSEREIVEQEWLDRLMGRK